MSASEQTPSPSAARERALLARLVQELAGDQAIVDVASLTGDPPEADALVAALHEHTADGAVIACAGVLEHLADFVAVVEALVAISANRGATVVLAVPNQAYGGQAYADRASAWGEGAVGELRRLLPPDHVLFHEVALRGAALLPEGESVELPTSVEIDPRVTAPVAFVLAFGPRATRLAAQAEVAAADVRAEREHERALTAELDVLRAVAGSAEQQPALAPPNGAQPTETTA
ncbi:MAG TPA: hypothetical protein VF257_02725 [Solirubrobacteraceae bacterium]